MPEVPVVDVIGKGMGKDEESESVRRRRERLNRILSIKVLADRIKEELEDYERKTLH